MTRAPWPLRVLALAFLMFCGCKTTSKIEKQETSASGATEVSRLEKEVTQSVRTGPEDETIYRFALPESTHGQPVQGANKGTSQGTEPDAAREGGKAVSPAKPEYWRRNGSAGVVNSTTEFLSGHDDGLPPHGPLVEIDVIHRGSSSADTHETAKEATAATRTATSTSEATEQKSSAPAGIFAFLSAFWPLLAAGLVAVAVYVAWKFRTLIPWWPK
jgi:hypothetical protein